MPLTLDRFTDSPLGAAEIDEIYTLYKAALEWRLAAPIVIRSADDILSADRWRDRVQPFHHQVRNLITFCRLAPSVLIADEVGLGKTISAGLILSELIARRRVAQALVICPRVLCDQWYCELKDKFRTEARVAAGRDFLDACQGDSDVVITTYESAARYLSHDKMPTDVFQMLILDEAHRLRNLHGPNGAPRFAMEIRKVIEARRFTYLLMLTATPIQNRFTDIYSLIDLLTLSKGHRNPLGGLNEFREHFLLRGSDGRRLRPKMDVELRQILNTYVTRTRRVDAELPFPTRDVAMVKVDLTPKERECEAIVRTIVADLRPLTQSSIGQALMSSPAALATQLDNLAATQPQFERVAAAASELVHSIPMPAKLQKLVTICDELASKREDWRVVVFTQRRATQAMIQKALVARGVPVGLIAGGRTDDNVIDIRGFMSDPPSVKVLVSTDTGAEGINLQAANVVVNYDLPWNPMLLEQRIGRVQRLGSCHRSVHVLNLVASQTVEEKVVVRLLERLMMVADTVGDLESILAGIDNQSEEGSGERFENLVRNLVVSSLKGQDIDHAAQLQAASIERARQEYESNYGQMNRDLGALDAGGGSVPFPELRRCVPSLSAEEFVRRVFAAEGRRLREVSPGIVEEIDARGIRRQYAFHSKRESPSEHGENITIVAAGQPAFERLIESWANRRSHRVIDVRSHTEVAAESLARAWCGRYPTLSFVSCRVRERKTYINGRVLVRTTAENRLDQHQRLIEYSVTPSAHQLLPHSLTDAAAVLRQSVALAEISPRAAAVVRNHIASDEDINRFATYYANRRTNELSRAGSNPHLRQRIDDDFTVTIGAEVVGFQGACYEEAIIDVTFALKGHEQHQYQSTLQAIPSSGQIIEEPTVETCPHSGIRMPFGVLARCERAGTTMPRHCLRASDLSGRLISNDYVVRCEVTAMFVADDEVERCAVTGRLAVTTEFVTCERTSTRILRVESGISDVSRITVRRDLLHNSQRPPHRRGLPEETVRCASSGRMLLCDEVAASAVSQKVVDSELLHASERTGRLGMASEMVTCQQSNRRLLADEVGQCAVTSKVVDQALLSQSSVSGLWALTEHMLKCSVSGQFGLRHELEQCSLTSKLALPKEFETCGVTGQRILRQHMVQCSISGNWLAREVAVQSDVSGGYARVDLMCRSERSPYRLGLPTELVVCEITAKRLLSDEVARSIVTQRLIDRDLLVGSGERLAHPTELIRCEVSGREMFPDEIETCSLTGQCVALDLLVRSEVSGRLVLATHTTRCAVSNRLAACDEVETCALTGDHAVSAELETCTATGTRALRSAMVKCTDTNAWLVPTAAGQSDYRPRWVAKSLLHQSKKAPGRWGTVDEFGICAVSGDALLLDELEHSRVSGRLVDRDLLRETTKSRQLALPDELVECEETGDWCLPNETAICESTGRRVSLDLVDYSPTTRRLCLKRLFVTCAVTHRHVPMDETETCAVTGKRVERGVLVACAVTGKRVVPRALETCAVSGDRVLPSELGYSDYQRRPVKKGLLRRSSKRPGRWGTNEEFGICAVTRKRLLLDEMARSAISQVMVDRDLTVKCGVSGKTILKSEAAKCIWLNRPIAIQLGGYCELTRGWMARKYLDANQMLQPLAEMLDGKLSDKWSRTDLIPVLQSLQSEVFERIFSVHAIPSVGTNVSAVCVRISKKGWFGTGYYGVGLLMTNGRSPSVVSDIVIGKRGKREWLLSRRIPLSPPRS